jgi:hypothetical protein
LVELVGFDLLCWSEREGRYNICCIDLGHSSL